MAQPCNDAPQAVAPGEPERVVCTICLTSREVGTVRVCPLEGLDTSHQGPAIPPAAPAAPSEPAPAPIDPSGGKVVTLVPKPRVVEGAVDHKMVGVLETMLAEAKEGKLVGFAYAALVYEPDGHHGIRVGWTNELNPPFAMMVGSVQRLMYVMNDEWEKA